MVGTQHCGCEGRRCLHELLAKRPERSIWDHIRHVKWVLARYLGDRPNSCLEVEEHRVVFILLTMRGDPQWKYRVDELLPRARDPRPWGSCCWCDWEPMGMDIEDLLDHLRLEGPHDLEYIPTPSEEDAPPPEEESTDEEGDSREEELGSEVGGNYGEGDGREEAGDEENPEEDPEEDLGENPDEDPNDDSEISEGQLMGSEDFSETHEDSEEEELRGMDFEGNQEEEEMRAAIEDDHRKEAEGVGEGVTEPAEKKRRFETAEGFRKRGRCGRICRGLCPQDAPGH